MGGEAQAKGVDGEAKGVEGEAQVDGEEQEGPEVER